MLLKQYMKIFNLRNVLSTELESNIWPFVTMARFTVPKLRLTGTVTLKTEDRFQVPDDRLKL